MKFQSLSTNSQLFDIYFCVINFYVGIMSIWVSTTVSLSVCMWWMFEVDLWLSTFYVIILGSIITHISVMSASYFNIGLCFYTASNCPYILDYFLVMCFPISSFVPHTFRLFGCMSWLNTRGGYLCTMAFRAYGMSLISYHCHLILDWKNLILYCGYWIVMCIWMNITRCLFALAAYPTVCALHVFTHWLWHLSPSLSIYMWWMLLIQHEYVKKNHDLLCTEWQLL